MPPRKHRLTPAERRARTAQRTLGALDGRAESALLVRNMPRVEITPQPPAGSVTHGADFYSNTDTVPTNTFHRMTWVFNTGTGLLDLTNPNNPTVLRDGLYTVTANYDINLTAGNSWLAELHLDSLGVDALGTYYANGGDAVEDAQATITVAYFIPAGGTIYAGVKHKDGANRFVQLNGSVLAVLL